MKKTIFSRALGCLTLVASASAQAAPAHSVCADIGPGLAAGVSHFAAAGDWAVTAEEQHGVDWRFMYWYLVPVKDAPEDIASWIEGNLDTARSVGAIPVFTFYQLLGIGKNAGVSGKEPEVVKKVLTNPELMKTYFEHFIFVLQTVATSPDPVIVHVEPDSWGFMMWAMGVDGNPDATSVPVEVDGSGHPDVAGLPDHAGGLGQALLRLRDRYAPAVRLGWHASNFRNGTGGDVVAKFYASMGSYDLLFSEHPHVEGDPTQWWLPWDEAKVRQNLSFFVTVTSTAGVPMLLWQEQIGTTDFHLFSADPTMRERFAMAGVAGVLFSMRGSGKVDAYRADEEKALASVPPGSTKIGGTAADMRERLADYARDPLTWPVGSVCEVALSAEATGGCSCRVGDAEAPLPWLAGPVVTALALAARRRRRR